MNAIPATPPSASDAADRRRRLRRMQWLANGLLLLAVAVFALATRFQHAHPAWPYVAAFAEAAMVGALADWFAVVALFRHPLGLSFIPHTAIIPANRERIASNLGAFVQGEFFATERVLAVIRQFDPAGRAAAWFARQENADRFGELAVRTLSWALEALDEEQVREYFQRAAAARIGRFDLARLAGSLLAALTADGRHQALLDHLLEMIEAGLARPETRERMERMLADELPLYFDRLKLAGGRIAAERIVAAILRLLHEVNGDAGHALRHDFQRMIAALIEKLQSDPDWRLRIEQFQRQLAEDPCVADYLNGLWRDLRQWLAADLRRPDSSVRARAAGAVHRLALTLRDDGAMRQWINDCILQAAPALIDEYRPRLGGFIAARVAEWKDEEIVDKLEQNIGRDLQFIRVNGTLVGGCVGLLIYLARQWLGT